MTAINMAPRKHRWREIIWRDGALAFIFFGLGCLAGILFTVSLVGTMRCW